VPRPEVLRALAALQERGLVVRLGRGRYDFVEPMFGEYVRRLDEGLVGAATPSRRSRAQQSGQSLPGSG
jgi:DNA-binding IclR family transcriptional regulator